MRTSTLYAFAIAAIAVTATLSAQQPQGTAPQGGAPAAGAPQAAPGPGQGQGRGGGRGGGRGLPAMLLTSTAWPDGGVVPAKYVGGQQGVSPALSWGNVPPGTVEFVLIMTDPEPSVPLGSATGDILHWLVAKIPAATTSLPEGAGAAQSTLLPEGARQIAAYRGPGAPATDPMHHYTLTIYALNAPLDLAPDATRASVMAAMEGKVLTRGMFGGRFHQTAAPAGQ
jgi:Raf kinase inhibitor-like YbhB/YbcL family protein